MSGRAIKVKWVNITEDDKKLLANHTEANYTKLILQNYFLYNFRARRDIAIVLHDRLIKERAKNPKHFASIRNIFSEIYSKYIQTTEDLALVGLILLKLRPTLEIYMDSTSSTIMDFYVRANKGFSDKEVVKLLGLDKVYHYLDSKPKLNSEEVANIRTVIKEAIKIQKSNLRMLANIYLDQTSKGSRKHKQGGPIDVYNSIKHGYKAVYPTKIARKLWKDLTSESFDFMHQLLDDESSGRQIVRLGGFKEISDDLIESVMHNINLYSDTIQSICETKLLSEVNIDMSIKILRLTVTEERIRAGSRVKHFQKCLCGSRQKYKKCCDRFKNEASKADLAEILEIQ